MIEAIDIVKAEVPNVDLYSIISSTKESQFKEYGRVWDHDYKAKMQALKDKKFHKRLQENRLAREVIKSVLSVDYPVAIKGQDYKSSRNVIVIPQWTPEEISNVVYGIMNDDGLFDFTFYGCGSPNQYCFETEMIYWEETITRSGNQQAASSASMCKFELNPQVREAVRSMLKPFEAEKQLYIHQNK
jgi:hypothetical protein